MRLITAFGTGLLSGGLSCVATQGGLLAGMLARRKAANPLPAVPVVPAKTQSAHHASSVARQATGAKSSKPQAAARNTNGKPVSKQGGPAKPGGIAKKVVVPDPPTKPSLGEQLREDGIGVGSFLLAKLVAHLVLGAGLGWLGSALRLDTKTRGVLQIVAAVILALFALDLLGVKWARNLVPRPPERLGRFTRKSSRSSASFGPAILGALTVLIPCGVTLGIEFLAVATGSPIEGALLLGAFVLGTMPVFAAVGLAAGRAAQGTGSRTAKFRTAIGTVVLVTALLSFDSGLALSGSSFSPRRSLSHAISASRQSRRAPAAIQAPAAVPADGIQRIRIEATGNGYSPSRIAVKAGVPLKASFFTSEYG